MTIFDEIKKKIPMPSFEIQKKELTMINTLTGKSKFTLRVACRVTYVLKKQVKQKSVERYVEQIKQKMMMIKHNQQRKI